MKEVEYIEFNNIDYLILSKLEYNNNQYVYMVNENDPKDFYIRKIINENGKNYYTNIDNSEEFENLLKLFYQKLNNEENC